MDDATQKLVDELIRLYEPERAEVAGLPEELNAENLDAWAPFVMERTARTRQLLSQLRIALEAAQRPSVNLPTIPGVYAGQRKTRWELDTNGAWWFRGYEGGAHPTPEQQDRRPSDVLDYGMPLILLAQRPPVNSVVEAIDAARDSIARGELASVVIDTDDYPQRPPVSENVRDLVDDLRESAAQSYEELSQATIDVLNRAVDYISRPPVGPEVLAKWGYEMSSPHVAEVIPWAEAYEPLRDWWLTKARKIISASFPSQPVYDEEKIARWLAYVASDWTHDDCGDDDHPFGHTNWQAWLDEAAAFIAALRGGELTREETNE